MERASIVRTKIVYMSPFGAHDADTVPEHIRKPVEAIKWTKAGRPDRRSKASVRAWEEFEAWSQEQWNA